MINKIEAKRLYDSLVYMSKQIGGLLSKDFRKKIENDKVILNDFITKDKAISNEKNKEIQKFNRSLGILLISMNRHK